MAVVEVKESGITRIVSSYCATMNPVQKAFHEYNPPVLNQIDIRGLFGGSGLGKTRALGTEALMLALEYPKNLVVIARDVLADLKRTTKVTFLQEVMPSELLACKDVEWREGDHKLVLHHNKSEIHFIGLDEPGRIGSLNCGAWGIDEAHLLKDPAYWHKAFSRQTRRHGVRRCGMFVGHPQGKTSWLYRKFFVERPQNWAMFTGGTADNEQNLPEGFVDQLRQDLADDPQYLRRYLYGDWEDFEGLVFSEFDESKHVIDPFEIPKHWVRYRGMDYGMASPTTCEWAAVDENDCVYFYDEYGCKNTPIPNTVYTIDEKTGEDEISCTLLDGRSAGVKYSMGLGLVTIRQQYLEAGLPVVPSATGKAADVEAGIMRMKALMSAGKFKIFRPGWVKDKYYGCPNLIKEISSLIYKNPKEGAPVIDKYEGEDHYTDAARYITGHHYAGAIIGDDEFKPGSLGWLMLKEDRRMRAMMAPNEWYE